MAAFGYDDIKKHEGIYMLKLLHDIKESNKVLLADKSKPIIKFDKTLQKAYDYANEVKLGMLYRVLYKEPVFTTHMGEKILLTKIEKTPYSMGDKNKPTTQEQEVITANIFRLLLSSSTPDYELFDDAVEELQKLVKFDIRSSTEWYKSFRVQFDEIRDLTKLPNSTFDVYNRDGGFMNYVINLVKEAYGISQKDAWNPADIWLINSSRKHKYDEELENIRRGKVEDKSPARLNELLRHAFNKNDIVGVSLKKNNGKKAFYDLVNLEVKDHSKYIGTSFKHYSINTSFDGRKKEFDVVSSNLAIDHNGTPYDCYIRRNTGESIGRNVYEFTGKNATAQLGKVPLDYLSRYIKEQGGMGVPDHSKLPKTVEKLLSERSKWITRLKRIHSSKLIKNKDKSSPEEIFANMVSSYKAKNELNSTSSAVFQIILFAYTLSKIKNIDEFSTDIFFASQKKGKEFGPFGKLY
jgi:hypothetical protein